MKIYKGTGMILPVFSFKMFDSTNENLLISFLFFTGIKQTNAQYSTRLINNWEFVKQDLRGICRIVRPVKKQ